MARGLAEPKVLDNLGIQSFQHLPEEKVPTFISMLPDMPPEVANKAIDIVLGVPKIASEIVKCFQETLNHGLESNASITKDCNDADRAIIDGLLKQLDRVDLSSEERKDIRDELLELSRRMHDTNTENKSFVGRVIDAAQNHGLVVLGVVIGLVFGTILNKPSKSGK